MKGRSHCTILMLLLAQGPSRTRWLAHAHTLGLHSLSGENPSGAPVLPAIRGPFEVAVKLRFNPIAPGQGLGFFQTIFEYSIPGSDEDTIWFGHSTSGGNLRAALRLTVAGNPNHCFVPNIVSLDTVYSFKFGVDPDNTARIYQDGALIGECFGREIPRDVPRNHNLKTGYYNTLFSNVEPLNGAILGLQVKNLDGVPVHPKDTYALLDFPSQTFGAPFVASFFARFDDISNPDVIFQRVFDFSNGAANNNIICGQRGNSNNLACEVYSNTVKREIIVPNAIVEGEFAFWHFGLESDGTMWVEKDGVQVAQTTGSFQQVNVFRSQMLFGKSAWPQDSNLNGVVLGYRLDGDIVS